MKTKHTKKFYIITPIVSTVLVGIAITLGIMIGQDTFSQGVDYSSINQDQLEDDNEALMKKYHQTEKANYVKSFKTHELINISLSKVGEHQNVYVRTIGSVNAAGVVQQINGLTIKDNDAYFNESISSSSLVKTAWRFYEDDKNVTSYKGSLKTSLTAAWNESSKKDYTLEEFDELWGRNFTRPSIYIISTKTVNKEYEVSKDDDGNYLCSIDLNPTLGVVRYVKQMSMTSGLKKDPVFHSVHLDFHLDLDLNLLSTNVTESYDVQMFGKHTSNATIQDVYTYDKTITIPELNEDSNYEGE